MAAKRRKSGSKKKKQGKAKPTLTTPGNKYKFRELVALLQKDPYFARRVHEVVKYGRRDTTGTTEEVYAMGQIKKVLILPFSKDELDEIGLKEQPVDKCSNNTTFSMLDFCRYV